MKQASYDWVLFDLDETLLDFPVAQALERTLQIYGVTPTPPRMAAYHELNHRLWQQYNSGEINATRLQQMSHNNGARPPSLRSALDLLLELAAGMEGDNAARANGNGFPRARIAASACVAFFDRECSKAAQFDTVAPNQCFSDFIEGCIDDRFNIAQIEMRIFFSQFLDQFGTCHS